MIKDNMPQEEMRPEGKKIKNKSFSEYMDISIIVAVVVLFIAIIFTFLIDFVLNPEIDIKDIGVNTVIISACTISIYLLVRSLAMRKGRRTKAWTDAYEQLIRSSKKLLDGDRAKLIPKYCRAWEEERLNNDTEDILLRVGISLEDFKTKYAKCTKKELKEKYLPKKNGKEVSAGMLTDFQYKTVLKAKKVKRLKFDERYFYVNISDTKRHRSPSSGLTSAQLNRVKNLRIAITTILTSLVSASILKDIIIDFSAESIIKCVVKLAIIIFFGAIGMVGGYNFSTGREVSEMNSKSDEIEIFLKWCENLK